MALPLLFGTWEEFLANWCLGNNPREDRETIEDALRALFRFCPEQEVALTGTKARGLMIISPAIEKGVVLSACEKLTGFENVMRRLKTGERSAYSELLFAARLVKIGFQPVLEPRSGSGVLDTLIPTSTGKVYCEVIAPETSDAIREIKTAASTLAGTLKEQNAGRRVEVLLLVDFDEDSANRVAEAVKVRPDSSEIWSLGIDALPSSGKLFETHMHINLYRNRSC